MINYPYLKLFKLFISSKFKKQIDIKDKSVIYFRAGLFDIDLNNEINNGRYQVLCDLGRYNHGFLTSWFKKAIKYKFYPTVVSVVAKFRYRIPFGKKFKITTQLVFSDKRWLYFQQNFYLKDKLCSSFFVKTGTVKKGKLINNSDLEKYLNVKVNFVNEPNIMKKFNDIDQCFHGFKN